MSATIRWQPVRGRNVETSTPSKLLDALHRAFGDVEMLLGPESVDTLRGMDAAGVEGADELARAVEKHGTIRVWAVW